MRFATPLARGRLLSRYKRFLADIALDSGETITATCPNTGTMLGLTAPGSHVWVSESDSPTRKYRHTWELVETDLGAGTQLVGINTGLPNRLLTEAIEAKKIKALKGYASLRREVKYGVNSRIDLLLECERKGLCYVEIKNVHMMRTSGLAEFPDCVTERGRKHLVELTQMVRDGHRAVMVYLIQRADADRFALAPDIDAAYVDAFQLAKAAGVEALAVTCKVSTQGIEVIGAIPMTAS